MYSEAQGTEQKLVIFERIPGSTVCNATMAKPQYDSWFASRGVSEADFDEVMLEIIAPINAFAERVLCYLTVAMISCGLAGWCCQVAEQTAIPGKIQAALDKFHAKYPSIKGSMSQVPPGLVFTGAVLASPAAVVAQPMGMEREDPQEILRKLKSMLDEDLIKQAEYDTKKAEVLSRM